MSRKKYTDEELIAAISSSPKRPACKPRKYRTEEERKAAILEASKRSNQRKKLEGLGELPPELVLRRKPRVEPSQRKENKRELGREFYQKNREQIIKRTLASQRGLEPADQPQ